MTVQIVPLADVDPVAVETLLDRAFGADRRGRTAYRLRQGTIPVAALSFAAVAGDGALSGTIQCWPVVLAHDDGGRTPMVLVGPVAVAPEHQHGGIGRALMQRALAAAPDDMPLMLVGDPEYYGRFFAFTDAATGKWRLPGPFEPRRLLARGQRVPDVAAMVEPRPVG